MVELAPGKKVVARRSERSCGPDARADVCLDLFMVGGATKSCSCGRTLNALHLCGRTLYISMKSGETLMKILVCDGMPGMVGSMVGRWKETKRTARCRLCVRWVGEV